MPSSEERLRGLTMATSTCKWYIESLFVNGSNVVQASNTVLCARHSLHVVNSTTLRATELQWTLTESTRKINQRLATHN
ncbi:hypothetical protein F442_18052 [Phytophthora nicotianae P10297]|uniref:Uncharacterized protein n=1 Tax=Phytophthora nicotianae P10297 TaxID=1317064 RepID=W2YFH6_PHYNI|nr:hypothetical protein F442_18052 [Phytophthora nicotianae P10297]